MILGLLGGLLRAFENRRDALTAADAHRDQRTLASGASQLVERLDRQDGASGSNGVAQRDTAAVGIGAVHPAS